MCTKHRDPTDCLTGCCATSLISTHLVGPVCTIYNASVREKVVLSRWKKANVVLVPKVHPPRATEADRLANFTYSHPWKGAGVICRGSCSELAADLMTTSTVLSSNGQRHMLCTTCYITGMLLLTEASR